MTNRTVIITISIALVLLGFIVIFERGSMTTDERMNRKNRVFADFQIDHVEQIAIQNSAGEKIALGRAPSGETGLAPKWRITAPKSMDADEVEVRAVLSGIDFLMRQRQVDASGAARDAKYGLDAPRVRAAFEIRGQKTAFRIGADAPGEKVYLAIEGRDDQVIAVDGEFLETVDKSLDELRSKAVFSESLDDVIEIKSALGGSRTVLRRASGQTDWRVDVDQSGVLAAAERIEELLGELRSLKAVEFVADDVPRSKLAEYGLIEEGQRVDLKLAGGVTVGLLVGDKCEAHGHGVYAGRADGSSVICIEDHLNGLLKPPSSEWIEKRPSNVRVDDLGGLTLSRAAASIGFEKVDERWQIVGKPDFEVEQSAVDELIDKLSQTKAATVAWGSGAVNALGNPTFELVLDRVEEQSSTKLSFFMGAKPRSLKVRRADELAVLELPVDALKWAEPIRADELAFRERKIRIGQPADVETIEITGQTAQTVIRKEGVWKLVAPIEIGADSTAVSNLVDRLAEIEVRRFVAKTALAEHGLDRPVAEIEVRLAKEAQSGQTQDRTDTEVVVLQLGESVSDGASPSPGRFARLRTGDAVVFTVGPELQEAIARPFAARDLFQIDETEVVKLVVRRGDDEIEFTKQGDGWQASQSALANQKIGQLVADLGGIKSIHAVRYLDPRQPAASKPLLTVKSWTAAQLGDNRASVFYIDRKAASEPPGYLARLEGMGVEFLLPVRIIDELLGLFAPDVAAPAAQVDASVN